MTKFSAFLSDFQSLRPPHETSQEKTLKWLLDAHCKAEVMNHPKLTKEQIEVFRKDLEERLMRVGCKSDNISKRGHCFDDFVHRDWSKMHIYRLDDAPTGLGQEARSKLYEEHATNFFDKFYENSQTPPDDLIHVSCTGYTAPSAAQKLVSRKGWGSHTHVTHAYHMGCYGSMPALRMAKGFLASSDENNSPHVDIVHTEICSLHTNPSLHRADQLVAQSLFADGFIKYTATSSQPSTSGLKLLGVHEEVIPNSLHSMTWNIADWGFDFFLSKDIPVRIARHLEIYLSHLLERTKMPQELCKRALFAVHPGGPKVLKYVADFLGLEPHQLSYSQEVLYQYGNMSSATLPHIWEKIVKDPKIEKNTPVISLAFGPGLSICGSIMEKC